MGISKRYEKAEAILSVFECMYGDQVDACVQTYRNGRENGFIVTLYRFERLDNQTDAWVKQEIDPLNYKKVFFTEGRNHDGIVVYVSDKRGGGDGELTDEMYENQKSFDCYSFSEAATYIFGQLTMEDQWLVEMEESA